MTLAAAEIAKNRGVVSRIEKVLGLKAYIADEPQIIGALGAAILARKECDKNMKLRSGKSFCTNRPH